MRKLLGRRFARSFAITIRQEKIADQIAGRLRFAQLDDRVELARERLVDRTRQALVDDFSGARRSGVLAAWRFDCQSSLDVRKHVAPEGLASASPVSFVRLRAIVLRDHFIDQAELQRFRRGIKFPLQNDFGGFLRTDQPRQARRATPRRHQTQRRFRKTDARRGRIRRDAVVTGQRDLVAATGTSAVDRRHRRNFQRSQPVEDALTFGDERTHLAGLRLTEQRLQIGARDEDRLLRRGHDHTFETWSAFR